MNSVLQRSNRLFGVMMVVVLLMSLVVNITTVSAAAPTVPQSLSVINIGDGFVTVGWTAPASDGGSAITDYEVQNCDSAGSSCTIFNDGVSTDLFAKVTGLTNGTEYTFKVAAVNADGTGSYTAVTTAVSPAAQLQNGSFEADVLGSTALTNWTFVGGNVSTPTNGFIDLGQTNIGGCQSEDLTDYNAIWYRHSSNPGYVADLKNRFGTTTDASSAAGLSRRGYTATYPSGWPNNDNDTFNAVTAPGSYTTTYTSVARSVHLLDQLALQMVAKC